MNYYYWSKDPPIQPKEPTVPAEQHVQKLSRQFYQELDGNMNGQIEAPDPKGSNEFWSEFWSEPVEHNKDSEWLKKVK